MNQNYNGNDPDILKLLYQVAHSKNAIGAGGFSGAGLFGGLQTTLGYVPESKTDFIFAVVGEQMGLLGTTALVALLSFIAYRMFRISRESHDALGRFIAMGAYVFFAFSCFQNIGMTLGIMPVTGIPLPMISYGGSYSPWREGPCCLSPSELNRSHDRSHRVVCGIFADGSHRYPF